MDQCRIVSMSWPWLVVVALVLVVGGGDRAEAGNVTYDGRSLIIDGQRKILFSGSIHYSRSLPNMWSSLIAKAKEGGIDVIQTYVFWNLHEPRQGKYMFSGRGDIVRFIKKVQAQGLYVSLRIGPFIQSEWKYGGLPFWLHDIPGIVYRSDNEPFKYQMQKFTAMIVNMMKEHNLFASQGGPIIISQIENEYQTIEAAFGEKGPAYVRWAAAMAVGLETGVPWMMCKQIDAPDPVINACNGMRCGETFTGPNKPYKPAIWTENWTSFVQRYGEEPYLRSAEDIAFQTALFIAKGGSFVNYYMYHGGTNLGRTAAAFMTTGYYDQAPLDEYGLVRQPKWNHLKQLHEAVKSISEPLLFGTPSNFFLGTNQQAFVFSTSEQCAAFLVNNRTGKDATVVFHNTEYVLPPKSISILRDCQTEIFNTGAVSDKSSTRSYITTVKFDSNWQQFQEPFIAYDTAKRKADTLLEQMSTTKDKSDYLWYTISFQSNSSVAEAELDVYSRGNQLHALMNGVYVASAHAIDGKSIVSLQTTVSLNQGTNYVSLLSVMVGLPDSGAYLERRFAGIRRASIQGWDFTNHTWRYRVGLSGEAKKIYTEEGSKSVQWNGYDSSTSQLLTWYKTTFDALAGNDPVALNMISMGKGEIWVNGRSIGRYWVTFRTHLGNPSQTWYHIPRGFLKPTGNLLVILAEESGNPLGITLDSITVDYHN